MRKPRILWCGEASFLNTGYAIYGREILSRLYSTKKYEIAELSSYGKVDDNRRFDIPWTYYGNMPMNETEKSFYDSVVSYQFGQWRFEEVCMDFKPDIVCDIRDWWMIKHEMTSAFRDFYKWIIMPAVDCDPLREECVDMVLDADCVLAYSEYGQDVINNCAKGVRKRVEDVCSPSASENFSPVQNKDDHKESVGFMPDVKIIGTIMRNQKRKLFSELIDSFRGFIEKFPEQSKNTYLYLHTSYPDIGWNIPQLLKESGVSNRILVTYQCSNGMCMDWFPSFYRGESVFCSKCGKKSAVLANSLGSLHARELAKIINCFDLYVQYSICEGFGMPQVEAAMCGVPIMSVDHSAMSSVINNIGAIPLKVNTLFRELETHGYRAYPDNEYFIDALGKFFSQPKPVRQKQGRTNYINAKERYSWDKTAEKWESIIDQVPLVDHRYTWNSPPKILPPSEDRPEILQMMTSDEIVKWGILNVLRDPTKMNSYLHMDLCRKLDSGLSVNRETSGRVASKPFSLEDLFSQLHDIRTIKNMWEDHRVSPTRVTPDFVRMAKRGG